MIRKGALLAISISLVALAGCSSSDDNAPAAGTGGSSNTGGSSGDAAPDHPATGTGGGDSGGGNACSGMATYVCYGLKGMKQNCPTAGQICCLTPSTCTGATVAQPYVSAGAASHCDDPSASPSGFQAACKGSDVQLCGLDTDCPTGYHCDMGTTSCVQGAAEGGVTSDGGTEAGTSEGGSEGGTEAGSTEAGSDAAAE